MSSAVVTQIDTLVDVARGGTFQRRVSTARPVGVSVFLEPASAEAKFAEGFGEWKLKQAPIRSRNLRAVLGPCEWVSRLRPQTAPRYQGTSVAPLATMASLCPSGFVCLRAPVSEPAMFS